ncbi:MAG: hypothetical protein AAGF19_04340 [Pseudomonadota bacterium]
MFSPYYAWAGRRRPTDHVAINVALYAQQGNRWSMTERGEADLHRTARHFQVGPSSLAWEGQSLVVTFDEMGLPRPPSQFLPERIRGSIRLVPDCPGAAPMALDAAGRHHWWPVAPSARISLTMASGAHPNWEGHGYSDSNWGSEPLEVF